MTKDTAKVKAFMQAVGQATPPTPMMPSKETRKLRCKLILEEALETIDAMGYTVTPDFDLTLKESQRDVSLVAIADGLADLHYVGYCGTALACGLDMRPLFDEVHRANMDKFWDQKQLERYKDVAGLHHIVATEAEDTFVVLRADGKIIKPPDYNAPMLGPIILNQQLY